MNGNTKAASDQMTMAQMQLSMLHMKSMSTMNEMQALGFMRPGGAGPSTSKMVAESCIMLLSGELQRRDDLTELLFFL